MKRSRILILVIALAAGGIATMPASGNRTPETRKPVALLPLATVDVLVAKTDLGTNVRVLAVDQAVEENEGQEVVVGKTATVELDPQQAETLALSRQMGTISLALRSLLDSQSPTPESGGGETKDTRAAIRCVTA
jgi:Flp pilus assembly protein CpaB